MTRFSTRRAEADALLAELGPPGGPIDQARLVASRSEPPDPRHAGPPADVTTVADVLLPFATGPIRVRVYRDGEPRPRPLLLWLHGGGWVGGSLDDIDATCRALAAAAPVVVVSLDYRLAPEHPYPAALDDTYGALEWLSRNGGVLGGDGRVAAGGQSAGANLVAAACLLARGQDGPEVTSQVLCYPSLDADTDTESYRLFDGVLHSRAGLEWSLRQYLGGAPVTELVAPLRASSLTGLPPALILAAGRDMLRDDARRFHARLDAEGTPSTLIEYPEAIHAFFNFPGLLSVAHDAVADIAAYLRAVFAEPVQRPPVRLLLSR